MNLEPIKKFWLARTNEQLERENARLRSHLLAAVVVAAFGWLLFFWRLAQ